MNGRNDESAWTLIAMCGGYTVAQLQSTAMPFWIDALASERIITRDGIAWIVSSEFMLAAASNLLMLTLIYRFSTRAMGLFGTGAILIGSVSCVVARTPWDLLLSRCSAGIGEGILFAIVQAMGAQTKSPDRTYSITNAALFTFGLVLLTTIPSASQEYGAAGIFGVTALFAGICLLTFVKAPANKRLMAPNPSRSPVSPSRIAAALTAVLLSFIEMRGLWVYAVVGGHRLAISSRTISNTMVAAHVFGVAGSALAGLLVGRFPRITLVAIDLALLVCAALLFGYTPFRLSYLAAICLLSFVGGNVLPLLFGLLADTDPAGRAAAAGTVTMMLGSAIGAPAVGIALQHGSYSSFLWGNCAALVIALALTAFAAHKPVRPGWAGS
jgi:predicted MFS family arabinose efflux permease